MVVGGPAGNHQSDYSVFSMLVINHQFNQFNQLIYQLVGLVDAGSPMVLSRLARALFQRVADDSGERGIPFYILVLLAVSPS